MIKPSAGITAAAALALAAVVMPSAVSLASPVRAPAAGPAPVAWVTNEFTSLTKGSVTPIDTATNKVIKTIPVPRNAIDVVMAPNGKTAYVALDTPNLNERGGSVVPVSTSTYKAGPLVKVSCFLPATMAITPNGMTLYVADWDSGTVTPVSTATNTAGKPVKTGADPYAVVMGITPDGKTLYVVNEGGSPAAAGTVTPVSTATNTAGKNIRVGSAPGAIVFSPDGKTAYVLDLLGTGTGNEGSVTPISTATNTPGKPIPVAGKFPDEQDLLLISPSGKTLYAVGLTAMTPISTATGTAGKAIRVAPPSAYDQSAIMSPDGKTIYVAGNLRGQTQPGQAPKAFVVPVNTATGAVGKAITFRGIPFYLALAPDGKTLYVVDGNGVIPVSTTTGTAGKLIATGGADAIAIAGGTPAAPAQASWRNVP